MQNYDNPRQEIWEIIEKSPKDLLTQAGKLHGHYCPYLALGVKAGVLGIRKLSLKHEGMEEVIAIVEANNCFSDGIQYSTGCTFGNNSMIYKDYGKTAVTLTQREKNNGIRIAVKPEARDIWDNKYPEYQELFDKVVKERTGDEQDKAKMKKLARKISFEIIGIDSEEIFKTEKLSPELPEYAPIFESVICSRCGESVMKPRIVEKNDEKLCIPCAGETYHELNGGGITQRE